VRIFAWLWGMNPVYEWGGVPTWRGEGGLHGHTPFPLSFPSSSLISATISSLNTARASSPDFSSHLSLAHSLPLVPRKSNLLGFDPARATLLAPVCSCDVGCTVHEVWSLLAGVASRWHNDGTKREGEQEGSPAEDARKSAWWDRLTNHARNGELLFVTARPPPPDYDAIERRVGVSGEEAQAAEEDVKLTAIAMASDNPSLRCASHKP